MSSSRSSETRVLLCCSADDGDFIWRVYAAVRCVEGLRQSMGNSFSLSLSLSRSLGGAVSEIRQKRLVLRFITGQKKTVAPPLSKSWTKGTQGEGEGIERPAPPEKWQRRLRAWGAFSRPRN